MLDLVVRFADCRFGIYGRECAAEVSIYITGFVREAGSTITFPGLMGHQAATWANELGMAGR